MSIPSIVQCSAHIMTKLMILFNRCPRKGLFCSKWIVVSALAITKKLRKYQIDDHQRTTVTKWMKLDYSVVCINIYLFPLEIDNMDGTYDFIYIDVIAIWFSNFLKRLKQNWQFRAIYHLHSSYEFRNVCKLCEKKEISIYRW